RRWRRVDDAAAMLSGTGLDSGLVTRLERAAPIYRKAWWPAHRDANRAWQASILALVDRHRRTTIDFVTKAYALPSPASVSAARVRLHEFRWRLFARWRRFLVVSGITDTNQGLHGFEIYAICPCCARGSPSKRRFIGVISGGMVCVQMR